MKNLTSEGLSFPVQRAPEDGDEGEGLTFEQCYQDSADRTAYMKRLLDDGVPNVRLVGDVLSLKALTDVAAGSVAFVATGAQLFCFIPGSTVGADLDGLRYDSTAVAGYWASPLYYLSTEVEGVGQRQDLSVLAPPNSIVRLFEAAVGAPENFASGGSWRNTLLSTSQDIDLKIGDIVSVRATVPWSLDLATEALSLRIAAVLPNNSVVEVTNSAIEDMPPLGANKKLLTTIEGRFIASADGLHAFKLQFLGASGAPFNISLGAPHVLRGQVVRP